MDHHITIMCGRVIQSSAPMRYAIVDGLDVRDSRVHNYPPRWNGAPSQDLLVIRRSHDFGQSLRRENCYCWRVHGNPVF